MEKDKVWITPEEDDSDWGEDEIPSILGLRKELKKLKKHLEGKSTDKLKEGYQKAKKDFEKDDNQLAKGAMMIIKQVLEERGEKVEV